MSKIISASRRTDIPAFYGEWFMNRVAEGYAGWENPFGGQRYLVSLKPEDVSAIVLWSKNYRPFLPHLDELRRQGLRLMFNCTITGLPRIFECNLVDPDDAIDSLRTLSTMFSPEHINWRYDPIVLSDLTGEDYHLARFAQLCDRLQGLVTRCYFSFATMYGKVERNFARFSRDHAVAFRQPDVASRVALANRLAEIAAAHGISMHTCCGDALINDRIHKAHCIDGDLISKLHFDGHRLAGTRPTRKECGCTESTDIGCYDTCPHGCVYCYANVNKEKASRLHGAHDPQSAFLGMTSRESGAVVAACFRQLHASAADQGKQLQLL